MKLKIVVAVVLLCGAIVFAQQGPTSSSPPSTSITTPVSIANGGTGQITATLAFNALSPVTTRGDLIVRDATNNVRFAKCTTGQYISYNANDPICSSAPGFLAQLGSGGAAGLNPADATTYYVGTLFGFVAGLADGPPGVWVPANATLRNVYGRVTVIGTLGSNDGAASQSSIIVRKNSTTDIATVTSTLQLTAAGNDFNNIGLSVAVTAGDSIYIKFVAGTWTTNPTAILINVNMYFDVP